MQNSNLKTIPHYKWYGLSLWLPLTVSIYLLVLSSIFLWIHLRDQRTVLLLQEQERATLIANTVLSGLTVMMAGNGHTASNWLNLLAKSPDIKIVQIIRENGEEAFLDLSTIEKVNSFLGTSRFHRDPLPSHQIKDISPVQLANVMLGNKLHLGEITQGHFTHLLPVHLHESCRTCHGYYKKPVIAVLRLTTHLNHVMQRIERILFRDLIMHIITIIMIAVFLYLLVFYWVIIPIKSLAKYLNRIVCNSTIM